MSKKLKRFKYLLLDDCCMIYVPSLCKHLQSSNPSISILKKKPKDLGDTETVKSIKHNGITQSMKRLIMEF